MIVLTMKLKEEEDMIVETGKQDGFKCLLVNDMIHTRVKVLLTREYHFEQRPLLPL